MKIVIGGKKPEQNIQQQDFGGGFENSNVRETGNVKSVMDNPRDEIISMNRRLKILEERYTNLRGKLQVTEQNMLQKNKTFFSEIKTLNIESTELKKEISEIKDRILLLIKELETFAKRDQVDILKKYIDLWSPVRFVTKNEVEDIVRDVIENIGNK